jgi:hypothetical protein
MGVGCGDGNGGEGWAVGSGDGSRVGRSVGDGIGSELGDNVILTVGKEVGVCVGDGVHAGRDTDTSSIAMSELVAVR